jgi:hypothetical protein
VDRISIGALTKDVKATDFSMRLQDWHEHHAKKSSTSSPRAAPSAPPRYAWARVPPEPRRTSVSGSRPRSAAC